MIINILNDLAVVNLIGGTYRPYRKDFCGYLSEKQISDCHFDKCILGTDGYSLTSGFTTTDFESAKICETAIKSSNSAIILMDFHKYSKNSLISFSNGENITAVVTDDRIDKRAIKEFYSMGINVKIAKNDWNAQKKLLTIVILIDIIN